MNNVSEIGKRYENCLKRFRERLDVGLQNWSVMIHMLEVYANGENIPRENVLCVMHVILGLLNSPVLRYSWSIHPNFWKKEPIAELIARCNARLYKSEELITVNNAAKEIGVSRARMNRLVASGVLASVVVYIHRGKTGSKIKIRRMILRPELHKAKELLRFLSE